MSHLTRRHRLVTLTVALAAGAFALLLGAPRPADASKRAPHTVTTEATGTAGGVPDTATIVLGVDTHATTADEALTTNATKTKGVIDGMLFVGVEEADIATSGISLFPTFDDKGHITGYTVSTRMTAKTHDVPGAGKVIDAAAKLAGDDVRVESVSLTIEDTGAVLRRARTEAVRTAHAQADQLAGAAGAHLAGVRSIVEHRRQSTPRYGAAFALRSDAAAAIPVAPGTQDLEIQVKVVYALR